MQAYFSKKPVRQPRKTALAAGLPELAKSAHPRS
jgi:hypothetical protein